MLVAAGEGGYRIFNIRNLDFQITHLLVGSFSACPVIFHPTVGGAVHAGVAEVVPDGMLQNQSFQLSILRRQRHAQLFHGNGAGFARGLFAFNPYFATVQRICAKDGLEQFCAARTQHAGNAQNLAPAQFKAYIVELALAAQVFHLHHHIAAGLQVFRTGFDLRIAEHHVNDAALIDLTCGHLADQLAIAKHGYGIGDAGDFMHFMGNIENDQILLLQFIDYIKQAIYFICSQT